MYQHQFSNGFFRIDSDWNFTSRYICFTFANIEYDVDPLSKSLSIALFGIHFTIVWS